MKVNGTQVYQETEADRRLDRIIEIADELNLPLDDVFQLLGRCDSSLFRTFSDNPLSLPRYMKSKVRS